VPDTWVGCCGVRLGPRGRHDAFGQSRGSPIIDVALEHGSVDVDPGREIWRLSGEIAIADEIRAYDQRLSSVDGGAYLLEAGDARVLIRPPERRVVVQAANDSMALQLVTTMAVPILLEREAVLVLHACAAVAPDGTGAKVVCGRAGTGKSSLLLGLIDAGWRAVSEDVCVVDLRGPRPVVWPGPPWLRRAGTGPAASSAARFETPDKTAWDIAPLQTVDAVPVGEILFLESAGGAGTERELLAPAEVIRRLIRSTIWLSDPDRRAASTFHRAARLSKAIPCSRIRFAVADDWIRSAVTALTGSD
jgi:hypothetical protein